MFWLSLLCCAQANPPYGSAPAPAPAPAPVFVPVAPTAQSQRNVLVNGTRLDPSTLASLEMGGQRIPDGRYWYDPVCGIWGVWGQPPAGVIRAGLPFGPVPRDASGGGTYIFINGREIHPTEQMALVAMFGAVNPGRYWLDAYGNVGLEGSPYPIANLVASGRQAGGNGYFRRNDNAGYGMGSDGNSGYIMFDDGSGVSW